MKPRISMITLGVRDLDAAASFYEEGAGFPRLKSPPDVAYRTLNGSWPGLYGREVLAADATLAADGCGFESFALAHNVESEARVDEAVKQAVAAGAAMLKQPGKVFLGGYGGYFKDPDGHLWEVAHNPFFWIGPRDEAVC